MVALILGHVVLATLLVLARARVGRSAFAIGAVGPAATLVYAAAVLPDVLDGGSRTANISWVPSLDLGFDLRLDAYGTVFLLVIGTAGVAIFLHATRYFAGTAKAASFAATMTLFAGAMTGIVVSDHLLSVFVFWELTTITSYLLIGYSDHLARARSAALHAALVTGAGGLALLGGLVLLARESGTYLISELDGSLAAGPVTNTAFALILIGAVTKSAQFPFHGWLPGAMAAPTPASAFLHSATMVKAGIFLVGKLGFIAVAVMDWWFPAVATIGFITMALGGWAALRQTDLKLLLAYGTVSQLGFLFALVGSGDRNLAFGGLALLVAHAAFKASLFMTVGAIDKLTGTRDVRLLSGLARSQPALFWTAIAATASMAAFPLTFGFAAKEAVFDGLLGLGPVFITVATIASILTVAYSIRFLVGAFGPNEPDTDPATAPPGTPWGLLAPASALALLGVALGLFPTLPKKLIDLAGDSNPGALDVKLAVWPGFVPALGFSLASLALGAILALTPRLIGPISGSTQITPQADALFASAVRRLISTADRISGIIQNGSLPAYLGTILIVAVGLPLTALWRIEGLAVPAPGSAIELLIAAVIVVATVGLMVVRRRFAAIILLGAVGYGLAGLFLVLGGPDLAITQLLVETLVIGLFALVLRRLPAGFERFRLQPVRLAVAVSVAVFVFGLGLGFGAAEPDSTVSDGYLERSVPEAAGQNVVNVILVDFRGLDTLGEITVLAVAAIGSAGLVLPIIRSRREEA
ncbi:MAG: proton-conducting transporter membrane subunit [Acidimicrobiia bacterium]|nr:proton-conducting transporter membrane subunit [Acidimicrobiia bacterium]